MTITMLLIDNIFFLSNSDTYIVFVFAKCGNSSLVSLLHGSNLLLMHFLQLISVTLCSREIKLFNSSHQYFC
jgi:hypothetical protein